MTNRIEKKFQELKQQKQKAFIAFVTAGDPHLNHTAKTVLGLEQAGAHIVELGMPFSDPMADGPTIQKSSERALKAGTTLKNILKTVAEIRKKSQIPLLLMGYYNPVLAYGEEKFFKDAKSAGVDALLLVDLPPEEGENTQRLAKKQGISLVYLLAPTSTAERIKLVHQKGSGFIYYVSLTGVTGAALKKQTNSRRTLNKVLKESPLPVCVGFGVQSPTQAKEVASWADGVVVGSAIVKMFEEHAFPKSLKKAQELVKKMTQAIEKK